jgi:hypothetical protein
LKVSREDLLFVSSPQNSHAVLDVLAWFIALAASFDALEVLFDLSVAIFIFGTTNARRFIPN